LINSVGIAEFIELTKKFICFDIRSEGEYEHAHFPEALNLSLLNNEERKIIGTIYKLEGNERAVIKGYELVGPKFAEFIQKALLLSPSKEVCMYCWRGGLRSNIMAFLLHTAGFKVHLLQGGYKAFRNWVLNQLDSTLLIAVVGGKTGAGKTIVLSHLQQLGQQTIDLEALAHHKGSAFGALGQLPQPSNEHFENKLALAYLQLDHQKTIWVENESRMIGKIKLPETLYAAMRAAIVYQLNVTLEDRINHIKNEYGNFDNEALADCIRKLEKKLGNLSMNQALSHLYNNEKDEWVKVLLLYYDKNYDHSKSKRDIKNIIEIAVEHANDIGIAHQLIAHQKTRTIGS
jgi:tRNA 2-selenouridine synthase